MSEETRAIHDGRSLHGGLHALLGRYLAHAFLLRYILRRVRGRERSLILHLRGDELQKIRLVDLHVGRRVAQSRGRDVRAGASHIVGRSHSLPQVPSLRVASIRSLEVFKTSTLSW